MPGDDTVLATPTAVAAARKMREVINNGLQETLALLDDQGGDILSNPGEWSGGRARDFRENVWPEVNGSLVRARQQLDELALRIDGILADVMAAGGN